MQLLDTRYLDGRFWESILNLHSQPPALNFMLGVLLWLNRLTGIKVETCIFGLNFILGIKLEPVLSHTFFKICTVQVYRGGHEAARHHTRQGRNVLS